MSVYAKPCILMNAVQLGISRVVGGMVVAVADLITADEARKFYQELGAALDALPEETRVQCDSCLKDRATCGCAKTEGRC